MQYTETTLASTFSDLILNCWKFEVPEGGLPFIHETMPENTLSLVFINQPYYKGMRLLGPQTKKFQQQVYPGSVYLGIRFNPWVNFGNLFEDKSTLVNQTTTLPDCIRENFKELKPSDLSFNFSDYHLIEKGLLRLIARHNLTTDSLTKFICLQLESGIKIHELIKEIPLSVRPIQKHFKSVTGITMTN